MEAQLISYHKGDKSYEFLSFDKIKDYDDLNSLFFQVLARKQNERNEDVKTLFAKVPYLNSSLFEPTEIEHATLFISQLRNDKTLPIYSQTVLKDSTGKKRTGNINPLEYLFDFLNAYDFTSEGSEEIQEDNKTLINASVLGLIFEKINGYKDGSFFTPGFITMYMCRETIRKAVAQKFNERKGWNCTDINSLYNKIDDPKEANKIINELKICDPAVGSGHFLVSALNEIIAIKSDLKILQDREGKRLKEYHFEVVNDEMIVTDEDGELFEYNPTNKESQRIQETLFHEKQTIIENCLFGVDLNPNSVKICRLRLWIELLKNAYYKNETELETFPNIDINIKCGNSLISRFALDADLKQALKKSASKWTIDSYRLAVETYRNAQSKEQKREMERLINEIKTNFRSEISQNDPKIKRLRALNGELFTMTNQGQLFELSKKEKAEWNAKVTKLTTETQKLEAEIEEIKSNKIYENGFEWRFEFPEVLDDNGAFVGFDVVIGNPPYVYRNADIENIKEYFNTNYYNTSGNYDLYKFFIEQSIKISKHNGYNSLITNSSFLLQTSFDKTRKFLLENASLKNIVPLGGSVFEEATVDSAIYILQKSKYDGGKTLVINPKKPIEVASTPAYTLKQDRFLKNEFLVFDYLLNDEEYNIVNKLLSNFPKIETGYDFGVGINTGYIKDELTAEIKLDERYHPMVPGTGVSKYGKINSDGFIMYDKEFVKSKGKLGRTLPDEKFFTEPKILIVRTRNITLKERIIASIDYEKKYNLNRISNIISKDNNSIEGLLGVLNSKLFNWLYSKRYFDYEIKPIYLRNSPLCNTNDKELNRLVKEIIELRNADEKVNISKLISSIDQLVYQLYDLTEEEIKIIEITVK
ncbi:MAG: Eco57I restriction-modification methylase domain-containing protein [Bacteroidales bacterium]|nr:Eco57I restriction-modification methylase domain-containing protein [Bacteroidales bacterium]